MFCPITLVLNGTFYFAGPLVPHHALSGGLLPLRNN